MSKRGNAKARLRQNVRKFVSEHTDDRDQLRARREPKMTPQERKERRR